MGVFLVFSIFRNCSIDSKEPFNTQISNKLMELPGSGWSVPYKKTNV